jgi:pimeloyl-ACP methyl ester carboxylesterase
MVLLDTLPPSQILFSQGNVRMSSRIASLQAAGKIPDPLPPPNGDDCLPAAVAIFPAYVANPDMPPPKDLAGESNSCSANTNTVSAIGGYNMTAQLGALTMPTWIAFGTADPFGLDWQNKTAAALSTANPTVVTIPSAGHFPWIEQPDAFFPQLDAFFASVGAR